MFYGRIRKTRPGSRFVTLEQSLSGLHRSFPTRDYLGKGGGPRLGLFVFQHFLFGRVNLARRILRFGNAFAKPSRSRSVSVARLSGRANEMIRTEPSGWATRRRARDGRCCPAYIGEKVTGRCCQSKCIVEFAIREQTRIRGDDRAAKMHHDASIANRAEQRRLRLHPAGSSLWPYIIGVNYFSIIARPLRIGSRFAKLSGNVGLTTCHAG